MKFNWLNEGESPIRLKVFLKQRGISRRLLARVKYNGGSLFIDQKEAGANQLVYQGQTVTMVTPDEVGQDNVVPADLPIEILYEDDHYLVVNKPALTASIPSYLHPKASMANRVKNYYLKEGYANQVIHVVTRLDRDTTGVMLFAKHKLAHALMDEQLRQGLVDKRYLALAVPSEQLEGEGDIELPIERDPHSIVTRQVALDAQGQDKNTGQYALTSYEELARCAWARLYRIKLHTGRTHQIRVHFSYLGAPLLGDDLYGGPMDLGMARQALHCAQLSFYNALTQEWLTVKAPLPEDMTPVLLEAFGEAKTREVEGG